MSTPRPKIRRRLGLALTLLGVLLMPLALRPIIDQYTAWGQLAQAYPDPGIRTDTTLWFRTAYVNEVEYSASTLVATSPTHLVLNYHILMLRGGSSAAIPWDAVVGHRRPGLVVDWVVIEVPNAPSIRIRADLAKDIGLEGEDVLRRR